MEKVLFANVLFHPDAIELTLNVCLIIIDYGNCIYLFAWSCDWFFCFTFIHSKIRRRYLDFTEITRFTNNTFSSKNTQEGYNFSYIIYSNFFFLEIFLSFNLAPITRYFKFSKFVGNKEWLFVTLNFILQKILTLMINELPYQFNCIKDTWNGPNVAKYKYLASIYHWELRACLSLLVNISW